MESPQLEFQKENLARRGGKPQTSESRKAMGKGQWVFLGYYEPIALRIQ
jgi:hypothetical protein